VLKAPRKAVVLGDDFAALSLDVNRVYAVEILSTARTKIHLTNQPVIAHQKENQMPLLEIVQTHQVSATIRLDQNTAEQIDQYAAFLHASADEVVDKALAYVFTKDRDFQDFLRSQGAGETPQSLRIRRMPREPRLQSLFRRQGKRGRGVEAVNELQARN
jgi:hypothetical protein